MRIIDLGVSDSQAIEQVASIVVGGFREHWPDAWPNMEAALEEVAESFEPGRSARDIRRRTNGISKRGPRPLRRNS